VEDPFKDSLTPWSRVLSGQPVVAQLVKKFPASYGYQTFITVFALSLCPNPNELSPYLHKRFLRDPF